MMSYINEATVMGNLGADPILKTFPGGIVSCRVSIATTENTNITWHKVVLFGKLAEVVHHYMKKGDKLWVRGKIKYNKFKTKEGELRQTTDIIAQSIKIIRTKQFIESDDSPELQEASEAAEAVEDTIESQPF